MKAMVIYGEGTILKVLVITNSAQVIRDVTFCVHIRYSEAVVVSVGEGLKGIKVMETESPDLVVVDFALSDMDILDLVSRIRECSEALLFILYKASTDVDRAKWLEAGADDCIAIPFSAIELVSKVKVALRRSHGFAFVPQNIISFSDRLSINFTTHEVLLSGERVNLTPLEYCLLSELVRNEGRVLTHARILDKVWGQEYFGDSGIIKRNIYRLRKKLHDDADNPHIIHTEAGVGYKFIAPT